MKNENTKYQTMLKGAKNTEKVIIKEYHDGNTYGMSGKEIQDLAQRNSVLEHELRNSIVNN